MVVVDPLLTLTIPGRDIPAAATTAAIAGLAPLRHPVIDPPTETEMIVVVPVIPMPTVAVRPWSREAMPLAFRWAAIPSVIRFPTFSPLEGQRP